MTKREQLRRREKLLSEGRCLRCEQELQPGERRRRGQCDSCYQAMNRRINGPNPTTTLAAEIRKGLACEQQVGRPPKKKRKFASDNA